MDSTCHEGVCGKCWSLKFLIVGIVIIANQIWFMYDIWIVIGVLLILKGIMKFAMPMGCGHCCSSAPVKKGRK